MRNFKYQIRRIHRYLGLFLGIQFLLWTVGGLYFSWSNLDNIHGDDLVKRTTPFFNSELGIFKADSAFHVVATELDSVSKINLINILDQPHYQILGMKNGVHKVVLVNALRGGIREPLIREEAIMIANATKSFEAEIEKVELLTETNAHHEYREKPLPVWAITYNYEGKPTLYISPHYGQFVTVRQNNWRLFDALWMLHTMDYSTRDHFGNILLRSFSILGLITILSGFTLFYVSSPTVRKLKKK